MIPSASQLYDVTEATWPAARYAQQGPWLFRQGQGGGQRVSATTATGPVTEADIDMAEAQMLDMGQHRLFQLRHDQGAFDAMLAARGYQVVDPVNLYAAPVAAIATERPPRVCTFCIWEPLAIQLDIWAEGGIMAPRVAVMYRALGPKTSLLARFNDHPGGSGFVAMHNGIAMVHALHILPHQRRQGLGRYFMREAAFWAQDQGASHLALAVTQGNTGGNALYSSLGMQVVGQYHYRKHKEDLA